MKYPSLTSTKLRDVTAAMNLGASVDIDHEVTWIGTGPEIDILAIASLAQRLQTKWVRFNSGEHRTDKDWFEGRSCGDIHACLMDLPVSTLDDPGFWRYLSVKFFWWLVTWREQNAFAEGDYGKFRRFVDGTVPSECVLMRMFLRGQIAWNGHDYSLAWSIPKGADFWRSHVLRVRTGSAPTIARAFASRQVNSRLETDSLRELATRLNRTWSNVVLHLYTEAEAVKLLDELAIDPPPPS